MKQHFFYQNRLLEGKLVSVSIGESTFYVEDETGGYHVTVPNSNIIELPKKQEEIAKPKRYNKVGSLECWDVITDQKMDFLEGSILKYLWRHKEKNGAHDLKKAVEYLNKMINDYDKLYKK